jgi:hypothetical protein
MIRQILLCTLPLLSGCLALDVTDGGDLRLGADNVIVPLRLDDGVPLVEVWIGGKGPCLFKLDTGSGPTVVAEQLAARLRLPTWPVRASLSGANGKSRDVARVAELASVQFGEGATLRKVRAFVLPGEELDVHDAQRPVEGILGYSAFLECTLTLDFPRRAMVLSSGALASIDGAPVLPMVVDRKTPHVVVELAGRPLDLLVDTGNDQSLILPPSESSLPFVAPPTRGPVLATVAGLAPVQVARLDGALQLGAHAVPNPIISLMECSGPMLGAEILRHFRVSLDARHGRIRFERESEKPIVLPARFTDGLGLRRKGVGWQVVDVIPDSVADRAGIKVGDEVRAVEYVSEGCYAVEVGQVGIYRRVTLQREVLVK